MRYPIRGLGALVVALAVAASAGPLRGSSPQGPPDLTRGGKIPDGATHDWSLGATGARGWMHCEKMVTSRARQVAITSVERGSPADGVLRVGDILLGVGGEPFTGDPRVAIGRALSVAEAETGALPLLRWRAGRTSRVRVDLPVLGSYGPRAPFDCAKSKRILERGCEALAQRMRARSYRANPIPRCLNALALLASGDERYLPLVRREAQWAAEFSVSSFQTWYYGYVCILLGEYVLATGDQTVLPGLRRLAFSAAKGQSRVGSWGHKFALPSGRLAGYGMMNAPGIPLTIGLVLARAAGVDAPEVGRAIQRSAALLRFYVGKGAIPYGDHHPWIQTHEDNGKCGMGAVLFDLLGDNEAAEFFARMSLASHGAERDGGHTGNFFNLLWALPSVSLSGHEAAGAWMGEFGSWYFDLARRWDGTFCHLGPPKPRPDKYSRWDATGAYLIAFALPLRKLVLTGKRSAPLPKSAVEQIGAAHVEQILAVGRGWNPRERNSSYAAFDRQQILRRLANWSPVVRERAASALTRFDRRTVVPELVAMLESPRLDARLGACQALAKLKAGAAPSVPALRGLLEHEHLWLRVKAAEALGRIGNPAMAALPALLSALARSPGGRDPRGMEQRYLSFVVFDRRTGMLRRSLDGVDRQALAHAIRAGLQNEDGRARTVLSSVYDRLSFDQIRPLLPAIRRATVELAPSGIMFGSGVRIAGLRLLAKHRLREGIDACVHYLRHQKKHGSKKRIPQVLKILRSYGVHAQAAIPALEQLADAIDGQEARLPSRRRSGMGDEMRRTIRSIGTATVRPKLRDIR